MKRGSSEVSPMGTAEEPFLVLDITLHSEKKVANTLLYLAFWAKASALAQGAKLLKYHLPNPGFSQSSVTYKGSNWVAGIYSLSPL